MWSRSSREETGADDELVCMRLTGGNGMLLKFLCADQKIILMCVCVWAGGGGGSKFSEGV